jgi:5S rRNA maturation endonuclease (ribonuclease M5)
MRPGAKRIKKFTRPVQGARNRVTNRFETADKSNPQRGERQLRETIAECKRLFPLPELWHRLPLPGEPKKLCSSPFREDKHPSFSVFERDGLWFWRDHARDEGGDEIGFLMQQFRALSKEAAIELYHELAGVPMPQKLKKTESGFGKVAAIYDYRDAEGKLAHQTIRYEPKRFSQRRPAAPETHSGNRRAWRDRDGNWWISTLHGIEPVLYNLPQIVAAPADATIYLCEGEKDADRLNAILAGSGSVATTALMGSRKWRPTYTKALRGRDIIIFWDRDEPGRKHADIVAAALTGIARNVKLVDWDALWPVSKEIEGKIDLSDFLDANPEAFK